MHLPSSHNVTVAAENLSQAADNDVSVRKHINVQEVPDGLIDNHIKVIFVGQVADALKIRRTQ